MRRAPPARAFPALASVPFLLLAPARAQSVNFDVGLNLTHPTPSSAHGAAAQQPGYWNDVSPSPGAPTTVAMRALDGNLSAVTIGCTGGTALESTTNLPGASSDVRALLADVSDPGPTPQLWTIANVADGAYDLYTYAFAPDNASFRTDVVVAGSPDPLQTVGGAWSGAYALGVTHARHRVRVVNQSPIVVAIQRSTAPGTPALNYASLGGFQLVELDPVRAFCAGDGLDPDVTVACPCGNTGGPGRGCANSANAQGARLDASGSTQPDTLLLTCTGAPALALSQFLQGDAREQAVFGDGVRCAGGALVRLRSVACDGGASAFPGPGEPSVSQRGGVAPGSGVERFYQTYYRNAAAAFCPPENFNVTNGVVVIW